jgi:hypothetical protein
MTSEKKTSEPPSPSWAAATARLAERVAWVGFLLYAVFAPHSIAGAEISLALVAAGWLARTLIKGRSGLRRTSLDLPILLFFVWTIISSMLSAEPHISLLKIQSVCVLFLFYLTQAMLTRRMALIVVLLMITSGVAGSLWSLVDIARGRGVVITEIKSESPLRAKPLEAGDAIWRVGKRRISSVAEIDDAIRRQPTGERLSVSFISRGEHAEWPGFIVTDEMKAMESPSGIKAAGATHTFRASGWTRHYETFCETLQMLAQLALGLCLANMIGPVMNYPKRRWRAILMMVACVVLSTGIVLTAMRTVMLALCIGALSIAWRAARGRARLAVVLAVLLLLVSGALVVRQTRATGALMLRDDSASLRLRVARAGLERIKLHPFFGNGMDAVKKHWSEWGFPGQELVHLHSTPLQIAFDRGLPALIFWLWIMCACWRLAARAERDARHSANANAADTNATDVNRYGVLLGATGALAGFLASSLVNYNFGDGEVALVFWWLTGTIVLLAGTVEGGTQERV